MNKKEAKVVIEKLCANLLICPNCLRIMPNKEHLLKNKKCKWCKHEK